MSRADDGGRRGTGAATRDTGAATRGAGALTLAPGPEASGFYLVAAEGPADREATWLDPEAGEYVVGRQEGCGVRLAGETVSRRHARLAFEGSRWTLEDLGSRWGTFLNGVRLEAGRRIPLSRGDRMRVVPWTLAVADSPTPSGVPAREPGEDSAGAVREAEGSDGALAPGRLAILLEAAAALHSAGDEQGLAASLLKAASRGSGLGGQVTGAVLRPAGSERYEVLAAETGGEAGVGVTFSRSLLARASAGGAAELAEDATSSSISQSVVEMKITRALCVPVCGGGKGGGVEWYLYLDRRGGSASAAGEDGGQAAAFCGALARMAGMALTSLKRAELERRAAELDAELSAAAAAQQWILPRRHEKAGGLDVTGHSRPGRGVGGDFFDLVELGERRLAVALGDVSGKGAAAGVLMTATQGYLHALLQEGLPPAEAVSRLGAFVYPRRPGNRFVTLWVGIFDCGEGTLVYVDAGHGYALHCRAGECVELSEGGGLPVGVVAAGAYEQKSVEFSAGDSVLIVSDGLVEQPADGCTVEDRDEFGIARLKRVLASGNDVVTRAFEAVVDHAGTDHLADDATAVLVHY